MQGIEYRQIPDTTEEMHWRTQKRQPPTTLGISMKQSKSYQSQNKHIGDESNYFGYLKKFLPALSANIAAILSEILLTASAAWLITSAALKPPLSALSVGITLVRAAGISRAVLRYADRFLSHRTIFDFLDDLREKIFLRTAKILPLKSGILHEGEFPNTIF